MNTRDQNIDESGPCAAESISQCGNTADAGYDLCHECEGHYEFCTVCDEFIPSGAGEECRHLFWSGLHGYHSGCGANHDVDVNARIGIRAVLSSVGEWWAVRLRVALLRRAYWSQYQGSMLGPSSLCFDLGGRWSDGMGGGTCRRADAPADTSDPERGHFLVSFSAPGESEPGPVEHGFGRILTEIAKKMRGRDADYDSSYWMEGVQWLTSLSAADDCRIAERQVIGWIEEWFADLAGFSCFSCETFDER